MRPESGARSRCSAVCVLIGPAVARFGATFMARPTLTQNPGLKPWAILCNRFAVIPETGIQTSPCQATLIWSLRDNARLQRGIYRSDLSFLPVVAGRVHFLTYA
ncbi:MAG TPA: hypothetical protein VF020_13235 [Chthoniobacterales bacterium]